MICHLSLVSHLLKEFRIFIWIAQALTHDSVICKIDPTGFHSNSDDNCIVLQALVDVIFYDALSLALLL